MRVKEGGMMRKKDWIYALAVAGILMLMLISNIGLLMLLLSRSIIYAILYVGGMALILMTLTHMSIESFGYTVNKGNSWIKNHLVFWIMTDLHTLTMLARYLFPKERQGGWVPEVLFLIHLMLMVPVFLSERFAWYRKHELGIQAFLHLITYTMLSYSFIQFVIQTMT